jgi:hypothetical protein
MSSALLVSKKVETFIVSLFLLFFVVLGAASMVGRSLTYDEPGHFQYGLNILNGDPSRFDDSKMPFSALNAIPRKVASYLPPGNVVKTWLQKYQAARLATLFFSAVIALFCYFWSRKLYGIIPALVTLFLYVFDPNIIAHSQLITTDVYAMGTTTLVFFFLWRFAHRRSWSNGIAFSIALGLSFIAKYSTIVLLPLSVISIILYDFPVLRNNFQRKDANAIVKAVYHYALYVVIACFISILIINMAFIFNRPFTLFGDYNFRSVLFQTLQTRYPIFKNIPVPTPYPYLEGLDWVIQNERTGASYGSIYMLGVAKPLGQSFPGYYFVASLFKVPIASQLILLLSFIIYIKDKDRRKNFLQNEQFLLIPVTFYTLYFNFFYNAQIGIRYYLIVFPLLYIFAGSLFIHWDRLSGCRKTLVLLFAGYLAISVLSYFPYYITYFNELVPDKRFTYKYLSNSNLDWGQDRYQLDMYLAKHPEALTEVGHPQAGLFVIRANVLVGESYEWLTNNFVPDGVLANYFFIFKVTPEEFEKLCQSSNYCK